MIEHCLDGELAARRLAGTGYAAGLVEDLSRVQQRFGWHARVKAAFPADEALFHDRSRQAGGGGAPGENLAGRARADDNDVELRHDCWSLSSPPA